MFGATLYNASHICSTISSLLHGIWLPITLLYSQSSLWDSCLADSQAVPEQILLYIPGMF